MTKVFMHNCEFCQSENLEELKTTEFFNKEAILFLCLNCRHIFKYPVEKISANDIYQFYQHAEYNDDKTVKRQQQKQLAFLKANNALTSKTKQKVLEVGGGMRGLIKHFDENYERYAFDLDCNVKVDNETFGIKNYEKLDELGDKFDLIVLSHVFEHIMDPPRTYIDHLLGLLAENGFLFIEVPHALFEFCLDDENRVIIDNFTQAHVRSDTCFSYKKNLSSFKYNFIMKEDITLLWKWGLCFRNTHAKCKVKLSIGERGTLSQSWIFFIGMCCRILQSVFIRFSCCLKQTNPNIKILVFR